MTKKDYINFANVIRELSPGNEKDQLIKIICRTFREDNYRFDDKVFKMACELNHEIPERTKSSTIAKLHEKEAPGREVVKYILNGSAA